MDLDKAIAKAEAEAAKKIERLRVEKSIRDALSIQPEFVHLHPLYGRVGSMNFGYQETRSALVDLVAMLPPLPAMDCSGCFRTFQFEGGEQHLGTGYTKFVPIHGIHLVFNESHRGRASVRLMARVGERALQVDCTTPCGKFSFDVQKSLRGGSVHITRDEFTHTIEGARVITYASGSSEYAKSRTIVFPRDLPIEDVLSNLGVAR